MFNKLDGEDTSPVNAKSRLCPPQKRRSYVTHDNSLNQPPNCINVPKSTPASANAVAQAAPMRIE